MTKCPTCGGEQETKAAVFAFFGVTILGLLIVWCIGFSMGRRSIRHQAIEAGVAEYRCDPQTGVTEFHFKGLEGE